MRCTECRDALDAYVDGELDAAESAAVREHVAACQDCRREQALVANTSSLLRESLVRHSAPDVLKARLRNALAQPNPFQDDAPRRRSPSWLRLVAAGVVIAAASSLGTIGIQRMATTRAEREPEILASHLRSLMPGHLTDVASTNQHNVKPWFNGRVDFSPSVPNLDSAGFPLLGGRLDYVGGRTVAAVVYARRQHIINVYSWPAAGDDKAAAQDIRGYHLASWRGDGLEYWAVSDLNRRELDDFVRAFNASR